MSKAWDDYEKNVLRTARIDLPNDEQIKNALMGLCGEIGEVTDIFKKHFFHGHELDKAKAVDEIGDVLFYLTWLCHAIGVDRDEVLLHNVYKLKKRYPDGFDSERSINRAE